MPSAAVPAATTAAVAALLATLLIRVLVFEEGRTADLARANFVLAFDAIFLIFDLTGARFEDVLDLPRLVAFFISSSSGMCERRAVYPIPDHEALSRTRFLPRQPQMSGPTERRQSPAGPNPSHGDHPMAQAVHSLSTSEKRKLAVLMRMALTYVDAAGSFVGVTKLTHKRAVKALGRTSMVALDYQVGQGLLDQRSAGENA